MRLFSGILSALTFLILFMLLQVACKHEPVIPDDHGVNSGSGNGTGDTGGTGSGGGQESEPCDENIIYFQNEVLPVFVSNCAKSGCHDAVSSKEGIILDSYDNIMKSGVLEPFDASDSELYELITENDPDDVMPPPPANALSQDQIALIRDWINQGAENTVCNTATCDTASVTFSASVNPIIQKNCLGCHSGGTPSGNLDFSGHNGIQPVALNGRLLGAVRHETGFSSMPKGGNKLSDCDIEKIRIWINAGAPNN